MKRKTKRRITVMTLLILLLSTTAYNIWPVDFKAAAIITGMAWFSFAIAIIDDDKICKD